MSFELGADLLCGPPGVVIADHHHHPLPTVKGEGREGDVDLEFVAVVAQDRET